MSDNHIIREIATPLTEKAIRSDGTARVKIIAPGWGSSGYYDRGVLERDIPRAFPPGTKMFWNHDTPTEAAERPEGDLSRLAAVTVSPVEWQDDGDGGGMYAEARVFEQYKDTLDEIGEFIGVSIRGAGTVSQGEREGKEGVIVDEITAGKSVDFVTIPGAGGKIVQIFESVGRRSGLPDNDITEADNMSEQALQKAQTRATQLEETIKQQGDTINKLRQLLVEREARDFVSAALAETDLPEPTQIRLTRQLTVNPPLVEGKLNEAEFRQVVDTAVGEAQAEIAAILGGNGQVRGHGEAPDVAVPNLEEARRRQKNALAALGYGGNE